MKRKEVFAIVLMAASAAMLGARPSFAQNDLSLNVASGSECVEATDTVTVTLNVANLSAAINGVQVRLHYDNTLMTLVDIVPEDLMFPPPDEGWVEISQTDTNGDVDWAAVINGNSQGVPHTIATLTFTAIADGTAGVTFRTDADPFYTKLTRASDATTISPLNKIDSGGIFIGPSVCVITADDPVCEGSTGNAASVPDAGVGSTYIWTVTGGTITSGSGTDAITYTATDPLVMVPPVTVQI